jgi:hypothetical protein
MTVPASGFSGPTWVQTPGNSAATVFNFPFMITAATDLIVGFIVGGVYTQQTSGFTVSGIGSPGGGNGGGQVTFTTAPPTGTTVDLRSQIPETQPTNFSNLGGYYPESTTNAVDRVTRLVTDLYRLTYQFGIHGPDTESILWPALPAAASRAGSSLIFDSVTGLPEIGFSTSVNLTQSIFNTFLATAPTGGIQTSAESAAGVTPVNFGYVEGDIRRYGALTASTDNHVAINNALLVSANGGAAAFVPGGTWAYTSTLNIPLSASLYGMGQASILNANGCDGLTFGAQTSYAGSRFVANVFFSGTAASTNNGILVNFTAASGKKVYAVEFRNVSIENFGVGMNLRGLWDSSITNCWLYNNYQGIQFNGQSIGCSITGGFCQQGSLTGSGTQIALALNSVAGEQVQALCVTDWDCFSYAYGFSGGPCLDTVITGSSFNNCTAVGVQLAASSGGFVLRDCWVQTHNGSVATIGINLADLGSAVLDNVLIEGNRVVCDVANAGSLGIYVGSNQTSAIVNANSIGANGTQFATGLSIKGINALAAGNTINASATAILVNSSATSVTLEQNTVQSGAALLFSSLTPANFSYFEEGTFPVTLTGMASGGTGTAIWRASGGVIQIKVPSAGITGISNATTMTMTGLPNALWPNTDGATTAQIENSGATALGLARVAAASGVFTFFADTTGAVFANTGTKGLNGTTITYSYD